MTPDGEIFARHFVSGSPVRLTWRAGVVTEMKPAPGAQTDGWIAPGIFDPQVNGYASVDFQSDALNAEAMLQATRRLCADGCSEFFPTLITAPWKLMLERLRKLRGIRDEHPGLRTAIAGWHVEGPFLSDQPGFVGAHDPACTCDPAIERIEELRRAAGNDRLLLTLSPERSGAIECIARAAKLQIVVSLGHTNASADCLAKAVAAGASGFTHLGNGCPKELDRADNILWRVLETPGLTAGIIPDKVHVSPALFRIMHRLLPHENIYYTTDAMSAAGAPPGRYSIGTLNLEVGADRIVRPLGKNHYAGSALRPCEGAKNAAEMLGCPWQESWRRAALYARRWLKLPEPLSAGCPADFCFWRGGELTIYSNGSPI